MLANRGVALARGRIVEHAADLRRGLGRLTSTEAVNCARAEARHPATERLRILSKDGERFCHRGCRSVGTFKTRRPVV
jgi:hypothetical protein